MTNFNPTTSIVRPRRTSPHSRYRGSVYVFVLATSLLVSVIGLSLLTVTQINTRATKQTNDATEAEVLAEAAVEYAVNALNTDSNWRTTYTNGSLTNGKALGHGTISFKLVDESDGNLSNNSTDPVRVYGYGQAGTATKIYSVQLANLGPAVTSLQVATDSVGTTTFSSLNVAGSGTLASNAYVGGSGTFNAMSLESGGSISVSGSGTGGRTQNATARTFPDSTVFSQYTASAMGGGTITYSVLPIGSSPAVPTINHKLISPAVNPWGSGNAKGIYVVNCNGNSLAITNSRIVGTLVVLNANTVYLTASDILEPAVANYPSLLVQGNLQVNSTTAQVTESTPTPQVNMDPSSTPIPYNAGAGTVSNGGTSDSWNSSMTSLVYASGNVTISNQPVIKGVVIAGGTLSASGTLSLTYDSTYYNNPPPGFTSTAVPTVTSGTWRWETAP